MLERLLYNYFNIPTKLFSDMYLAKFLDTLLELFFPYIVGYLIKIHSVFKSIYIIILINISNSVNNKYESIIELINENEAADTIHHYTRNLHISEVNVFKINYIHLHT